MRWEAYLQKSLSHLIESNALPVPTALSTGTDLIRSRRDGSSIHSLRLFRRGKAISEAPSPVVLVVVISFQIVQSFFGICIQC